jgi:hypothetical protein
METISQELIPVVVAFLKTWTPPVLASSCAALAVWFTLEWVLAPLFALPGLRRFDPMFRALRPLLACGLCVRLFIRLNASNVIDFGPGEASFVKALLWAIVGTAGAQVLHGLLKKHAPVLTNEVAVAAIRKQTDVAVDAVMATVTNGKQPPAPPAGGGA